MSTPPKKAPTVASEQATNRLLNAIISSVTKSRNSLAGKAKKLRLELTRITGIADKHLDDLEEARGQVKTLLQQMEGMVCVRDIERPVQILRMAAEVRREMIPHLQSSDRRDDQSAAAVTYENSADLLEGLVIRPVRMRQKEQGQVVSAGCPKVLMAMDDARNTQGSRPMQETDAEPSPLRRVRVALDSLDPGDREALSKAMELVRSGEQPNFATAFRVVTRPKPSMK